MSEAHQRDQFHTRLKCGRCGADGHAVWEENSAMNSDGPMGMLVSMSENFFQRAPRNHQGQPEIACRSCGQTHAD